MSNLLDRNAACEFSTQEDMSIRAAIQKVNEADGGGLEGDDEEEDDEEEDDEEEDDEEEDDGEEDDGEEDDGEEESTSSNKSSSPDLTELMKNCGADEIKKAMKQAEVYDEVMTTPSLVEQIKVTPQSVLVTALLEAYDPEKLQSLVKDLTDRLRPKPAPGVRQLAGTALVVVPRAAEAAPILLPRKYSHSLLKY
jgi:hypothetical protein